MSEHGTHCPHCGRTARARTSRQLTDTTRETTYVCRNEYCGHVFVAVTEAVRTLSPPAIPNPAINLPFTPRKAPAPAPLPDDELALPAIPPGPVTLYRMTGSGWHKAPAR